MTPAAPESTPVALLVLGMHRSGTSAAAGALAQLGVALGGRLIAAAADNRKGYFEHADAVAINDEVLAGLERSWDDVRALPRDWRQSPAARRAAPRIAELVQSFSGSPLWALKDPRLCRVAPLWLDGLAAAGQRVACLFVLRHPDEVAASLATRDGLPAVVSQLLWVRHVLDAVRATAGLSRHMISFDGLLSAPVTCLAHAARGLGLAWPQAAGAGESRLADFLDASERHQQAGMAGGGPASPFADFAARLHARCLAVVAGQGEGDWSAIESMGDEWAELERTQGAWIETLGVAQQAGAVRARRVHGQLASEIDALNAQVAALDQAKASAEGMAMERLQALADADARLADLEAMALRRNDELQASARVLADCEVRLREFEADIQKHDAALAQAEALVRAGQAEARQLSEALAAATGLALSRLAELETLGSALAEAERLALSRQSELAQCAERIAELETRPTRAALDAALGYGRDAAGRIAALETEVARIPALETKGARIPALDAEVARIPALEAEVARIPDLEVEVARIADLEAEADRIPGLEAEADRVPGLEAEIARLAVLEAEVARMKATLTWRLTAPLRRDPPVSGGGA